MKAKEHPLYNTWQGMLRRASGKTGKKCYEHVNVFPPWAERAVRLPGNGSNWSFPPGLARFAEWCDANLGPRDGRTLDRIDGKIGYEPGNLRWATWSEQSRNRPTGWIKPTSKRRQNGSQTQHQ